MSVDFSRYQAPGVYTESVPGPQLSVQSSTPTAVGLFGLTVGYRSETETLTVPNDTPVEGSDPTPTRTSTLRRFGVRTATVQVKNPNSGVVYVLNTDYTIEVVHAGADGVENSRDDSYALKRVTSGHIEEGDTVEVTYDYTDNDYFKAVTFYDYSDIVAAYGTPFDANGQIQSELTLAARFALTNGAQRVVCSAVDPDNPQAPALSDYEDALDRLGGQTDVSIVVPATGMQQIQDSVVAHVRQQSTVGLERRAILGRDGSSVAVAPQQLVLDAQSLRDRRIMLVGPAALNYFAPELNKEIVVGGQFLAAALAGVAVSQQSAQPLTRKKVLGFQSLTYESPDSLKSQMSQSGVALVEKTRSNTLRVRHGVTTLPDSVFTREWSVVGQEDTMVFRLRNYLDADGLIGTMINDLTLVNVKASADAALQSLVRDNEIRAYKDLKVRQLPTSPDVVEISFEWQAALPLNYIVVRYSVNTTTGEFQSTTTTS